MLCQQHWWLDPSSFSHYFPLLRFPFQKPLADFPVLGGPKGLTSNLSFPKASRHHPFQTHILATLPFVLFPKWVDSFLSGLKTPSSLPSWCIFLRSLRYPTLIHELLVSKSSAPFLHHWVTDGTHLLSFFVFLGKFP